MVGSGGIVLTWPSGLKGGKTSATTREGGKLCRRVCSRLRFGIFCMDLGIFAPQTNGHPSFVIQGKALWEQCAMLPAVLRATLSMSPDIAKSGISPNLDRDKMFDELWRLNYFLYQVLGMCGGNTLCLGKVVAICSFGRCGQTDVGDYLCYGDCFGFCTAKLLKVLQLKLSFYEGIGIGAMGNLLLGGEVMNICGHRRYEITDGDDAFSSSVTMCLCITDQCF
mmetsp:Transcript_55209/g.67644  ORF Transcript_55209/g.67644 Transcript_55209/m.67644 type:complete len:223 (-) Transcript_55209:437-1105(-)